MKSYYFDEATIVAANAIAAEVAEKACRNAKAYWKAVGALKRFEQYFKESDITDPRRCVRLNSDESKEAEEVVKAVMDIVKRTNPHIAFTSTGVPLITV